MLNFLTKHAVRNRFLSMVTIMLLIGIMACNKDDDNPPANNIVEFTATMTGAQQNPPVTTAATGSTTASYNKSTRVITYTITWNGLSGVPTGMHFHMGAVGVNGSIKIPITGFALSTSGTYSGSATVDAADEADLLAGRFYTNIHTAANVDGEIRGQLVVK